MISLNTTYMGLSLPSPIIVSSNPLNTNLTALAEMEAQGAGAIVLPSLFEEQINIANSVGYHMRFLREEDLAEPLRPLMNMDEYNRGAQGYLSLIRLAKRAVRIPVIASLNGTSTHGWTTYARLITAMDADALELNLYNLPTYTYETSEEVEDGYVRLVETIKANIKIPLAVKISPYISALPAFVERLQNAGADAVVLFNRFYQPDIDLETESVVSNLQLSTSRELRLRLRWAALLYGQISAEIALTGGVHTGEDALKSILAGAQVPMVASTVLKNGIPIIGTMLLEMRDWMEKRGYANLAQMRGKLSPKGGHKSPAFERANYIQELHSYRQKHMGNPTVVS